ncbi:MAG: hypothetical protein KDC68_06975, partial [Gelidibacter sp.]|nr:hypothetical protein [Gelidibacter sp.]
NSLSFEPKIPKQWKAYSFKVNFRNQIIKVTVTQKETQFEIEGTQELQILVNEKPITIRPNNLANA